MLAQYLDAVTTFIVQNLPIVIGGGSALLVITVVFVATLRRRPTGLDPEKLAAATAGPGGSDEKVLNWEPPEQSYADRRGAVRRQGAVVRVVLASQTFRNGVADGYVLDRSTGGLKLASQTGMAPGSTLQVRAADAPDTVGFVTVIVRSCRKNADHYELGCEFEKTPPWNILLLFG